MKIIGLIDGLGLGGAQRQLIGLTKGLSEKGHPVQLVYYDPSHFYLETVKTAEINYKYLEAPQRKFGKLFTVFGYMNRQTPDCIITYMDGAAILCCLYKIIHPRIKVIVSERNTTQKLNTRARIQFFLYRFADLIISNSHAQQRFITEQYPNLNHKTVTITNFTDTEHFAPNPIIVDRPCPVILTVGRIAPQKNVLNYMRAIVLVRKKSSKPFKIRWVGNIADKRYYETCIRLIQELHIGDIFEFGAQTTSIIDEYHACDIFCLPSLYEGFPNVLCEAMACGLPVMCSNICDNANIVDSGVNGFLFDPESIESISLTLIRYLEMPVDKRREIGAENRRAALKKFSYESFIDQYIFNIRNVMGK